MNLISHKLPHTPISTYMVDHYDPDKPDDAVYIHPIECGILDGDGSRIEEYVFETSGLTQQMYAGRKPATQCFAVYNLEYESKGARNLMFSINSPNFDIFDESICTILDNYFNTINFINVGEIKLYQEVKSQDGKEPIKVKVERIG